MRRNKTLILLSHCILNVNSKVCGLGNYPGFMNEIVNILGELGTGIIQLPCPEMYFGLNRWGQTKNQLDYKTFRAHCRKILLPFMEQLDDYYKNGYEILGYVGVDGSPSCGVKYTCRGLWGGEFLILDEVNERINNLESVNEKGIFVEELERLLEEFSLSVPFYSVDEQNYRISLENFKKLIMESRK